MTLSNASSPTDLLPDVTRPAVRVVSIDESGQWLARGLADFRRAPGPSLLAGGFYSLIAFGILIGLQWVGLASLILPLCGGFILVAPLSAVLFYEISRRIENGEPYPFRATAAACLAKAGPLSAVGMVLMLAMLVWILLALVLFALFYGVSPPPLGDFFFGVLTAPQSMIFLAVGTVVGGALATLVFALAAVSLPMILDRDISALAAMATSIDAVNTNRAVMVGWAATIAFITVCGLLTGFIGLAFTLPLLGYSTWHAYRALVV
ncbi:DUF2189 domain-containing protein [Rhodospirillum rubrum]|uniref:Integral membrane protein n=1 Tax=Rhodospirillum rubrum (strain ATCC 11170 / ATH 1.1.1 / DSM 467 / LMG 4362 / NCIMB 8255 / S1) TaxID=269796 RepID=Q2RQS1_RHORT|nr:DUF2189 domain-containing protein [Rhodospirillum rubrum]ABC23524.1 conserved hypothetical protein [Rhodospirillum rubrum ATCC 11170]AEO49263.1 hypothetical protein F11_14005 [Rhodospirillum rubrum F11]MBK5955197.1 hypothetical protein [Rhodospirillum rubrum]QXG79491.1 DUF2189 domain-containing protein [Rhodospirillum rubrum]HAQ01367.1 DUF2189 domain-containing protein [Rhodospirillum rubrum]